MVLEVMQRYEPLVPPGRVVEDMRKRGYMFLYNVCHDTDGDMSKHAEYLGCSPEELSVLDGLYNQDPAYARFGALFVRTEKSSEIFRRRPLIQFSHAINGH